MGRQRRQRSQKPRFRRPRSPPASVQSWRPTKLCRSWMSFSRRFLHEPSSSLLVEAFTVFLVFAQPAGTVSSAFEALCTLRGSIVSSAQAQRVSNRVSWLIFFEQIHTVAGDVLGKK